MSGTARKNMKSMENNQQDTQVEPLYSKQRQTLPLSTFWAAALASLALSACTTIGNMNPQEQVSLRANQRWQALVSADFTRAYNFNTPGYRAVISPQAYRATIGSSVAWVGAEAVKVDCPEANKCTATIRIDFKPLMGGRQGDMINTHIDETWLFEDGQWWYFQPFKAS